MGTQQVGADSTLKTALYAEHCHLKAKMVPFGGWLMPVSYTSVLKEHAVVRAAVGMFDVSHMGELVVAGPGAATFLQHITINDLSHLKVGEGQYSAMCNDEGGMIDDLLLYRTAKDEYFLCVNASNTSKDFAWIAQQAQDHPGVEVRNESASWSQLAVQGPASLAALTAVFPPAAASAIAALPYTHITDVSLGGHTVRVARTGYTGEKGYELYLDHELAQDLWRRLLATGPTTGLQAIGLGARDTLRLEACYLLYGNDMDATVSPLEAGIGWATKLAKGPFKGQKALALQKEQGVPRRLYAFHMDEQGIPRQGMELYSKGESIGRVTSGSVLPTIGGAGGLALLAADSVTVGDLVSIDIRGKQRQARIVKRPFYTGKVKD